MSVAVHPPPPPHSSTTNNATFFQPSTLPLPPSSKRPPLIRKGTSYASNGSTQSQSVGCRLLWRGKIITEQGVKLHGVAIIAHLFSVPTTTSSTATSPPQTPSSFSPFDDPFSSSSKASSSGADMCLGLEMLRGKDLTVVSETRLFNVSVQAANHSQEQESSPEVERKKGKGKAKEVVEEVEVETPTDVRVYIDQRCTETVEWFQDRFCREGGQSSGLRLSAGGEQVIVFASIPDQSSASTTPTNSPSTSTSNETLPPLTLLLGRPIKPIARRPRPDDPLPRESLFTAKLRKTASLPASAFSKTSLSLESSLTTTTTTTTMKKKRLTSKDKAIASLLGKQPSTTTTFETTTGRGGGLGRQASNPPPSIAFPLPLPPQNQQKRSLSRSLSTCSNSSSSRLFSTTTTTTTTTSTTNNSSRQSSLPPLPNTAAQNRPFKRSKSSIITNPSSSQFLVESPPPPLSNNLESTLHLSHQPSRRDSLGLPVTTTRSRSLSRGPSPTPSITSTCFGNGIKEESEEGEGEEGEESDRLAELRDVGIRRQRSVNAMGGGGGERGMGMKRSLSLPSGTKGFLGGEAGSGRVKKEESESKNTSEVGGVEVRNKNTIKKLTMTRLQSVGVGRDHEEFKELFSMVTRGVGFALRATFKRSVLSIRERELAESLIEQHLRLYLPSTNFVNPLPMSMASTKPTLDQGQNGSLKTLIEKEEDGKASLQEQFESRGVKEGSSDTIVGEGDGDVELREEEEAGKSEIELLSVKGVAKDDDDDESMLEDTQVVETQMQ